MASGYCSMLMRHGSLSAVMWNRPCNSKGDFCVETFDHIVEWDQLDLRVRGAKLQEIAAQFVERKQLPVSDLGLEFMGGELRVSLRVQKGFSIPVSFTIRTITVVGRTLLKIPFESVATFGMVPIPRLLFRIIGTRGLSDGIRLDADTMTLSVALDRFLPQFIELEIESIRIVQGGVAVHLGGGGAGFPSADWRESMPSVS